MHLKLEDIALFVANWNNKADNIRTIAETLEIGLDSMVFIDDNPVERHLVRTMLPMVEKGLKDGIELGQIDFSTEADSGKMKI